MRRPGYSGVVYIDEEYGFGPRALPIEGHWELPGLGRVAEDGPGWSTADSPPGSARRASPQGPVGNTTICCACPNDCRARTATAASSSSRFAKCQYGAGDTLREAPAGSFVFTPRGTPHIWQNVGAEPLRFFATIMPAAVAFEEFFKRYAQLPAEERRRGVRACRGRDEGI
jgi:hypothetical protein